MAHEDRSRTEPDRPAAPGRPGAPHPGVRAPTRFSWVGVAALGAAGVIAFVVTVAIFLPALTELGGAASHSPASLPDTITVCGREWRKEALARTQTRDEVFVRTEAAPILVSAGPLPTCPPGVGVSDGPESMATVVYVQTGEDAFVPYSLIGVP